MTTNYQLRGPLLVLLASLCFSTSGFLQAIAPEGASPYVVAGCRMLVATIVLFVFNLLSGSKPNFSNWPWKYVWTYAVALWLFQVSFFNSTLIVGVAVGTVVSIGVTPIFSGLFTWFTEGIRPSAAWCIATFTALIGLVMVNAVDNTSFEWYDLLLPIFAGACYAVEIGVSKHLTEHHSPQEVMMLITFLVGLGLLPFFFFLPIEWIFTPRGICVAGSLGIVTCALAFSLMVAGMKTTSAPIASTLALGEPLGAAVLGIIVLQEPYSTQMLIGIALLIAAIAVLIIAEAKKVQPKQTNS